MAILDIYQQVFCLSAVANAATKLPGNRDMTQEQLQTWLTANLPGRLSAWSVSDWQPVWGPTVWTHENATGPDNAWYIAHNPTAQFDDGVHDTYVLAIAGTSTPYDWTQESTAVDQAVDFSKWVAGGVKAPVAEANVQDAKNSYIAIGTARGVYEVFNNKAPAGTASPGVGKTIVEYLATLPSTARLIIAGHSLGAALAVTVACALKMGNMVDNLKQTFVYPSAGFSPGNALFTQYFSNSFPITPQKPKAYQAWNSNLWNTIDAVPQVFSLMNPKQRLGNILNIWPVTWSKPALQVIVNKLTKAVQQSGLGYTPLPGYSFTGNPPPTPNNLWASFLFEHVQAYLTYVDVHDSTAKSKGLGDLDGRVSVGQGMEEIADYYALLPADERKVFEGTPAE